jgi:hypothetical protein
MVAPASGSAASVTSFHAAGSEGGRLVELTFPDGKNRIGMIRFLVCPV